MVLWVAKKETTPPMESRRGSPVKNQYPLVERREGYSKPVREFFRAVKKNDAPTAIRLLDDEKVDPDGQGKYGDTALMVAAAWGHIETGEALLEKGVNPNVRGRYWITPLMVAVKSSMNPEMIEMLIDYGAKVRARNMMMGTVLGEVRWAKWLDGCPETKKLLEQKWVEEGLFYKMGKIFSGNSGRKSVEV